MSPIIIKFPEAYSKLAILEKLKPFSKDSQSKVDKKFRLEFNYNSNHMEGNTLKYSETELLLIFDQTIGNHDYREYQEMQAHDVALRMVKDEAADTERPLTEQFIRGLNEHLLVRPFWKDATTLNGQPLRKQIIPGEYKSSPNSVRLQNGEIFNYSQPVDVPGEVAELVQWYNDHTGKEDAIVLASLLHYRFVRIHPFDDGNGRTARLLMNYSLLQNGFPLVVIKSTEKKSYLSALNRADAGDMNAFAEYIATQVLWSLEISIKAAKGESIEEEDDLDKELLLLTNNLKQLPDEFKKEISGQEIEKVFKNSLFPLFEDLTTNMEKVSQLFVKIKSSLKRVYRDESGTLHDETLTLESLKKDIAEDLISSFQLSEIERSYLYFEFIALKKHTELKNFDFHLNFKFTQYHYFIENAQTGEELAKLPFGRFLSKKDKDQIVKKMIKDVINWIKEVTNLSQ